MKFGSRTACVSTLALALSLSHAMAQEPATTADQDKELVQKRVVVTARKVEEDLQDIPVAVSVLSGDALIEANVTDFKDLQRFVPGLAVSQAAAEPSSLLLSVRGQSQADILLTTDSSVGLYIDNVNIPRTFGLAPSLVDIERAEVLKGPQGTLYGRNTTGGAVAIITRAPDLSEIGGYVSGQFGNYSATDLQGVFNLPIIEDQLGVRLLARNSQRGELGSDGSGDDLGSLDMQYYRGRLLWEPTSNLTADLTVDYTDIDNTGPSSRILTLNGFPPSAGLIAPTSALFAIAAESGLLTFNPTDPANQGLLLGAFGQAQQIWADSQPQNLNGDFYDSNATFGQFSKIKNNTVALNITYDLNEDWSIKSTTGYRDLDRSNALDLDATPFALLHPTLSTTSEFWSEELQLSYVGDRLDTIFGAYASNEEGIDGSTTFALAAINPTNPNRQRGDVTNESIAAYAQLGYELNDRLDLTAGLRWTEETKSLVSKNSSGPDGAIVCSIPAALLDTPGVCAATIEDKFSDWSYLLSLDYAVSDNVLAYVKTARGFRGGGQNIRGAGTAESFEAFEPETVTDYEIGVKSETADGRFRFNVSGYYSDYEEIQRSIVFATPSGTVVSSVQNAAAATIKGFEIESQWSVTPELGLTGTVGYVDASYDDFEDATGDRSDEVFQIPEWTYGIGARYSKPVSFGQFTASTNYSWRDDQVFVPAAQNFSDTAQEGFGLLSARLSFDVDAWNSTIAVYGSNLTDEEYIVGAVDFSNSLGWNLGYPGQPMTFGIELKKRFGGER